MMPSRTGLALMLLGAALSGCGRLADVGQPPELSGLDAPRDPLPYAVSPARAALAVPPPTEFREGRERASLWTSGPSSLYGDRRARRSP